MTLPSPVGSSTSLEGLHSTRLIIALLSFGTSAKQLGLWSPVIIRKDDLQNPAAAVISSHRPHRQRRIITAHG